MENAEAGSAIDETWNIQTEDLGFEFMMNALRLIDGVPVGLFQERTGLHINTILAAIKKAQNKGLLTVTHEKLQPTLLGQRFLNELLTLFISEHA
jgi:oxygen-independent coproporphyrinogen-3 oxidase